MNPPARARQRFADDNPRGFGLMQRDRNFEHYQDDGVFYDKRAERVGRAEGAMGQGRVTLVEIPTRDETFDNIVAFWTPAAKPQKGQEYALRLQALLGARESVSARGWPPCAPRGPGSAASSARSATTSRWRFVGRFRRRRPAPCCLTRRT